MSAADNSIGRTDSAKAGQALAQEVEFGLPPDVADRYEVRTIEGANGEQRFGLFRPGDRNVPAIEITESRIVARREDAETVQSLVRIAQHNGWDRIDVEGSPEFKKAVWTAGTRAGIEVSGYEPDFAEREQAAKERRERTAREATTAPAEVAAEPALVVPASRPDPDAIIPARSAAAAPAERSTDIPANQALSDDDSRLLLKISALTEDRKALYENLTEGMEPLRRAMQYERIDGNRAALGDALERALESPALVEAFARSGYEPDTLREAGRGGEWDSDVADAIYLTRSGFHRDTLPAAGRRAILADELDADREAAAVAASTAPADRRRDADTPLVREEQRETAVERRHEGDALAELFLHGAAEQVASDPRLAGALQAQRAMERHITEVFGGDTRRLASANLESRTMISDALRRGLDVSVREPTPVRQIEPMQTRPDLER